jgi:arylformamidase
MDPAIRFSTGIFADKPWGFDMNWGELSRAARDAAYNNAQAVPDGAETVEGWKAASRALREARPELLDLPYGPLERNKWDLFRGMQTEAPVLIFIHGGYWLRNTREFFACMAEGALARGWSAALPGYTLAPEASLTQIVGEIRSALDWLQANRERHGLGGPVILSGWSAGGHLAAMALDHPVVAVGLPISGVFELGPLRDTYIDESVHFSDVEIEALSPLRLPSVDKPMTIAYGSAELEALVRDSRALHRHRSAAHHRGALVPVPAANHFSILEELRTKSGLLLRAAADLVGA